ncbi:MAG TPA: hypothetical protein VG889_17430 [Rhizomicrobium sp.]|nr:hypothetical protein [Rhizomicrobium sp.]
MPLLCPPGGHVDPRSVRIDELIGKQFALWEIVVSKLEDDKNGIKASNDSESRATDVRVLAQLQRSLTELMKYEAARDLLRSARTRHEDPRAEIKRRMVELARAAGARNIPGEDVG